MLKPDEILRQFHNRHVLGQHLCDNRAAIQNNKSIGDLVHVGKVVLDIDAGAAGRLDPPHEIEDLPRFGDGERDGGLISTMRSALKCIARPMAIPCLSPPERLATVELTVMPTPRKPIACLRIWSAICFSRRMSMKSRRES